MPMAIANSLREDLAVELRGAKVLLLGAGGAGRTAALKLAAENVAELFLVNRTASKAEEIAGEIKKQFPSVKVSTGYPKDGVDLLLNATSLGLKPEDGSPLDEKQFSLKQTRAVYDMIYQPAETKLLAAAKAAGCKTANGIGMLVQQGAKAFEIWTGQPAPVAVMRRAVEGKRLWAFDTIFNPHNWAAGAVSFLVAGVLRVRLHRRQFPECLHLPDAAGLERRLAAVALSALQILHSVLPERAAADVADAARQMQKLRRADLAALLHRRTADRPGVSRCWLAFGASPRRAGAGVLPCFSPA